MPRRTGGDLRQMKCADTLRESRQVSRKVAAAKRPVADDW